MKPINLVCFSHGKESGPWGTKIKHLASIAKRLGFNVMSPDYSSEMNPNERVKMLLAKKPQAINKLVLVGSSMGGYVSLVSSKELNPDGLFVLAPAVFLEGFEIQNPKPTAKIIEIVQGWNDVVVPTENVISYANENKITLHLVDSDHRLTSELKNIGDIFEVFLKNVLKIS
ncbi:MAG: alpha/beta hydrolase [Calditrichaeota bacterium]|nr:MAG: alpha/beta hydrolase [Calditrichota bacterium]